MHGTEAHQPRQLSVLRSWACWGCVLWAVACFSPTLGFGFVSWDDPLHVTENPLVVASAQQPWTDHWLTPTLGYPTPVTVLSYRVEARLFGVDSALPFHATNLLLFGTMVGQVFALARSLGIGGAAAATGTLLFALHPVVAEPVSWVSGRKDLLAGVFGLLTMQLVLGLMPHRKSTNGRRWAGIAACLLAYVLALLSKPVAGYLALVLPTWVLLGVLWRDEGASPREDRASTNEREATLPTFFELAKSAAKLAWPFALLTSVLLPVAWRGQAATESLRTGAGGAELLREAWYAFGFHLRLLMGLQSPSAKYLPEQWPPPLTPSVDLLPLVVVALLVGLTLRLPPAARRPAWAGLSFALLSYLPTSNLIPLTRTLADVYVFMPLVGLAWWCAATIDPWLRRVERPLLRAVPAVACGALLTLPAMASSARWRDSVALWGSAYEAFPHDARLCRNLANARFELDGPEGALEQYRACASRFGSRQFDKNIGITLAVLGDRQGAQDALLRARNADPKDETVERYLRQLQTAP